MTTLVIAAHPDDEVLGCGGTIARLTQAGQSVQVLILSEGATSRSGFTPEQSADAVEELRRQSRQAGQLLGVREVVNGSLPDNRFDTVAFLDIVRQIETVIARTGAQIIYTQHGGDLNVDHQLTFRAALTAARPLAGSTVRAVYAYEVASSTEWAFQQFAPEFRPCRFVDISRTLEKKLAAMQFYRAEDRPFPHPRSRQALTAQAQKWGATAGFAAAEAFAVVYERE